ncbi:polysaccharide biosynthesis protein [Pontibacter toksunensis]|uniref:Polysaccharide biosynthesis protein n=1 Tax=Pontibacter toksunensis TaxID=1332631 RepID=A0ABW6BY90_9BACT
MKTLKQQIDANPSITKAVKWGRLITLTGAAQVVVQAVSFICGILVIRLLPTHEYALYTIANTMLGTITVLADGGVSTGVMAYGGKVHNNREELGRVLAVGFDLRKKLAFGSLLIATPVLLFLLKHNGASYFTSLLIVASLIPAIITILYSSLYEVVPKLKQEILPLQKIHIVTSFGRLSLLSISLFVFPWACVAILAAGLPQIWANSKLQRLSFKYTSLSLRVDPVIKNEILSIVKRILPNSVYYCFFGQISIWLLSIFGSTVAVAQIGALGRLSMVINIFYVLFYTLILPRFARLNTESKILLKRFLQIQFVLLLLSISLVLFVLLFSSELVWLLGENYSNLSIELLLFMIGACANFIAGVTYHTCSSRGWVLSPFVLVPVSVIGIIFSAYLFDVSSLQGILLLNIFIAVLQLIMNEVYAVCKLIGIDKHDLQRFIKF